MCICLEQKCGVTLASYNVLYQVLTVERISLKSSCFCDFAGDQEWADYVVNAKCRVLAQRMCNN